MLKQLAIHSPDLEGRPFGGPLFIVGASRSGSELLRSMLNGHTEIGLAGETHYFDDLRPRMGGGQVLLNAKDVERCGSYFSGLSRSYGSSSQMAKAGHKFCETWAAGTADEAFEMYCRREAHLMGKAIWGEKTPRHIFQAAEMLSAFPAAKILVLIRDPRSVVASYRDWRNQWATLDGSAARMAEAREEDQRIRASYSLTNIALLWRSAARQADKLAQHYGSDAVRLLRYEDLLQDPSTCMQSVCAWLGVTFETAMLDVMVVNSSYVTAGSRRGLDASASDRWRRVLSSNEVGYVESVVGRDFHTFGYAPSGARSTLAFKILEILSVPLTVVRALSANRHRIGSLVPFLLARLRGLF